jgi:hypothetical protein
MILYYAFGGGMGHLTRAAAVAYTLNLPQVALLTASPHAAAIDLPVLSPPATDAATLRSWLRQQIDALRPEALYLDAFPAGIEGELDAATLPPELPVVYVARRMRWLHYRARMPAEPPQLTTVYSTEPLHSEHQAWIERQCADIRPLELHDPPAAAPDISDLPRPLWLIVHSGPDAELRRLFAHADRHARRQSVQPHYLLIAPTCPAWLPTNATHRSLYPAWPLFAQVDGIVSGAGPNVMRQTAAYADKHYPVAFHRRYDDQLGRLAAWRRGGVTRGFVAHNT